ncbi:MAG: hypothetical protein EZS28_012228 [Streblomastix strix]|uniref:Tyr recombinase domain-containing protein n=1 Tax=Streblomastix strix TaxID=222440 RepID=A0A5J4WBE0_9EUKA|nr:MAG: hypothetical protein EZS28_012228 [Streblomastix strix]
MLTPAAILNAKIAIYTLLISIGIPDKWIQNNTTSTSIKSERKHTSKEIKDKQTYYIYDLLKYIRRRVESIDNKEEDELQGMTLALLMAVTTRRMSEISRAALQIDSNICAQFVLHTDICKIEGQKVTLTIKKAKDTTISPVKWFKQWWKFQESRSNNGKILQWDGTRGKPASDDKCLQLAQMIIKAADLPYKERIKELRAATITKMIDKGLPIPVINAWSIHSDTAKTLQRYYY